MKKGFIVFYINFFPDLGQTVDDTLNLVKSHNKELIENLKAGDYDVMFVPTTKEACRVEKVDFDKPFPRFVRGKRKDVEVYEGDEEEENS